MEYINGTPFSSEKINESISDLQPKLEKGLKLFIKTFLQDGFFSCGSPWWEFLLSRK